MFTRRHYKAIAKIIKDNLDTNEYQGQCGVYGVATDLADYFASDNYYFNKPKFLEACGIEQ
jgi:hypothetical protein